MPLFHRPNHLSLILLSSGLVLLSTFHQVSAQGLPTLNTAANPNPESQDLNLAVSPPVTYLSIKPGETKAIPLTIKNNGDRDLTLQLQLAEFSSDGQTGRPILNLNSQFTYLNPRDKAWNWGQAVVLKRDQTAQVLLDLVVPLNAPVTEHHITVLVKGSQISPDSMGFSSVAGIVGSNLVIAVANDATNLSQVEFGDWDIPRYTDSLKGIDITGLVKNTGRQAGPILGRATLLSPTGQTLKTWLFYPDMVLPSSNRAIRVIDTTTDPTAEPSTWLSQPNLQPGTHLVYQPTWLLGNYLLKIELYQNDYTLNQPRWQRVIQITAFPFGLMAFCLGLPLCYVSVTWIRKVTQRASWLH
jgi:hypothetical protein